MAKKGRIDTIVDIPKIQDEIKVVTDSLQKVLAGIENITEAAAKVRFDGFSKSKGVKETAESSKMLNDAMREAEPLIKELNSLMNAKEKLQVKLVALESDEAKRTIELKQATQARNREIANQIKLNSSAIGSLDRMRMELEQMKKAYAAATSDSARQALLPGIEQLSAKVTEAEHAMGVFNRQVGNYELAGKSMRSSLREMTEQLAMMKLRGEENSEAFVTLREKAGQLKDTMDDARSEIQKLASDTQSLDQLISVAEGLAGGYAVLEGASALMGVKNEELQQTFVKLQAAMAVLNGLRAIQNVLQKESAAYTLAENIQKKLGLMLTVAQNKAETGGIVTRKLAAAAQWALNKAMLANPAGLLLAGLAALVAIGYVLFKVFSDNAEVQKAYAQSIAETEKRVENLNRDLERNAKFMQAAGASEQEIIRMRIKSAEEEYDIRSALIRKLLAEYGNLTDEQKDQLKELQKAQKDNNDKIASLNDDLQNTIIKQQRETAKLKVDAMQDGLGKELAAIRLAANEEIKAAGDNADLVAAIRSKLAKDEQDMRMRYAEAYIKNERDTINKLEESRIGLMKDGFSKELAELKLTYGEKISELKHQLKFEEDLTTDQRRRINQTILNMQKELANEEEKLITKWTVDANKKQVDLINIRLAATREGTLEEYDLKVRMLNTQRQIEIAEAEQTGMDVAAINLKYDKLIADESFNYAIVQIDKTSRRKLMQVEKAAQSELTELRDLLEEKAITSEEYERRREAIENKYSIKRAENQLALAEKELAKVREAGADTLSAEEKLQAAQIALDDAKTANFIANRDKEKEAQVQLRDKMQELGQEMFSTIMAVQNAQFESDLQQIDKESRADEEAKQKAIERAGNNKDQIEKINARYDEKEKARETQRRKIEQDKARFGKISALFQIAINTAKNIVEASNPTSAWMIPMIVLSGALQAAAVAAQPLPKYFKGRNSGPAEWALVGEQGSEIIEHQGKRALTPDKPTVTWLPEGAKVIPHHKVQELINNYVVEPMVQQDYYDYSRLEDKLNELTRAVVNKKEFHLNITERGMQKMIKSGQSWQSYLERNVRI